MNLVRWFRKNNKKIMAVVVIVLMFGFVGGTALQRFLEAGGRDLEAPVAYFDDNRRITNYDLFMARRELETLRMLRADVILRSLPVPIFRVPDLRALLLGELLFSDRRTSPGVVARIRQMIRANEYRISSKQINDIYTGPVPSHVYWLLLKAEAEGAGIRFPNERATGELATIYARNPEITLGARYSQVIEAVANRQGISEDKIVAAFAGLRGVLEYAKLACSSEGVTSQQIRHDISRAGETIDVEFVRLDSSLFGPAVDEPTEAQVSAHFDKYNGFFAGDVSEENPYGFGYKLRDRAGLEYIVVKLDDVSKTVPEPTEEEAEEYYLKNTARFTEQVLSDPNDPNSSPTERVRSYAEVAGNILDMLKRERINSKAELILQEAKSLTEPSFEDMETDLGALSVDELRQMVGEYETAAEELSKKYEIEVYAGRTGLLTATDMRSDEFLGRLFIRGQNYNVVALPQIVFAIDELGSSELGPFDAQKPRIYENIGPARDVMERIMAVVRVAEAKKAGEPESVGETFGISTLQLGDTEDEESRGVYSVRENVVEDLKKLAAMGTAKSKAEEFKELAIGDGWDAAIERFNELYGETDANDANEVDPNTGVAEESTDEGPKTFTLTSLNSLQRISAASLDTLAVQDAGEAEAGIRFNMAKKEGKLRELLYSLVPQDSNTVEGLPVVVEFKPDMSYYCLKSILVRRVDRDQYEQARVLQAYREDIVQSQSLAAIHFNPENILKRMKLEWVEEDKVSEDPNSSPESEEGS
ncbi:MAG: hypothetical protein ACYS4W_07210 [Planctomycetota bacterium]|jgi:hypothetical protein